MSIGNNAFGILVEEGASMLRATTPATSGSSPTRHRRAARVLGAVAVILVATLGQASAATYQARDPRGDVRGLSVGAPVRAAAAQATQRTLGDIVFFRVTYSADTVRIAMRMETLTRSAGPHHFWFPIKTPTGTNLVFLSAGPRGHGVPPKHPWRGSPARLYVGTSNPVVWGSNPDRPSGCAVRRSIDYDVDRVVVAVPSVCLGSPAWIRAGGALKSQARSKTRTYADVALVRGRPGSLVYSPQVQRG